MCFHNSMNKSIRSLARRYGRKSDVIEIAQDIINKQYHVNAFTYPVYPVVTCDEELQLYGWRLIPFWVKTEEDAKNIRQFTLNARAETLFSKPSFREPARYRHCLIPSTGYFEWHHAGKQKTPYYIFLKEEDIFSIAGIYDVWRNLETGKDHYTFAMITTGTNELTGPIHNGGKNPHRMPAILSPEEEELWLTPGLTQKEIEELLRPIPGELMDAYIIRPDFLRKNPHDTSIIERA
ncbi:MAG: SOS response-associated peptidase [Tannerellaceae bacterium]|nr:SOS response-associated peptidase [Tannerellaceae bacterium]